MIVDFEQLPEIRETHKDDKIVFRGGCYDIVHEGHIQGLAFAKKLGTLLVVGVRPDKRVTERKGPTRPIRGQDARLTVVDAIRYVDYSFLMPDGNDEIGAASLRVVDALRPDIFVGTGTHVGSHPNDEAVQRMGAEIILDPNLPPNSTTKIIERIMALHMDRS